MKLKKLKLSAILTIVLCFALSFDVFAFYDVPTGSTADTNILTYYSGTQNNDGGYDYLTNSGILQYLSNNGIDTSSNNITQPLHFGGGISVLPTDNSATVLGSYYKFPLTSDDSSNSGLSWTASIDSPRVWSYVTISGYQYYVSWVTTGSGNTALVNVGATSHYLVSDQPFDVFCYQTLVQNGSIYIETYTNGMSSALNTYNNLYCYELNNYYNTDYVNFANIPVYISTEDKTTGFSNLAEFSFSNQHLIDCNYLFLDGSYTPPAGPEPPDPYENDKYYVNFYDRTSYTGASLLFFWHNNDFTFTDYTIKNPSNYRLHFTYKLTMKTSDHEQTDFYYTPSGDVNLSTLLGQSSRFGTGSHLHVPLSTDYFKSANNEVLSDYLKTIVTSTVGTLSSYTSPDDILSNAIEGIFQAPGFSYDVQDVYTKNTLSRPKTEYLAVIERFEVVGTVTMYTANNSNYESFDYSDYYNFLTGESYATSTQNVNPPYTPSDETVNTNLPVSQTGSLVGSSGGSSGGSTINVNVNNGGSVPWTPYTLDQVSYANVREMFADIKDFVDSTSSNSFWSVLERVFGYVPQPIWNYIIISVAVICGFSVVRYVLRR